jgi:hypothetical protein
VNPFGPRRAGADRPRRRSAYPPPNWSIPAKPGVLAPPLEREFFMGLEELKRGEPQLALQRFERAARKDKGHRALSDDLLAGLTAVHVGDAARAAPYLEAVVASDAGLPDPLLLKYAPELAFEVSITPEVSALITAGSMAAALALVECYQEVGRHEEAIGVLQQLVKVGREPALTLSLCELYAEAGDWDEVAALGDGIANDDDLTLQIVLYRATALRRRRGGGRGLRRGPRRGPALAPPAHRRAPGAGVRPPAPRQDGRRPRGPRAPARRRGLTRPRTGRPRPLETEPARGGRAAMAAPRRGSAASVRPRPFPCRPDERRKSGPALAGAVSAGAARD